MNIYIAADTHFGHQNLMDRGVFCEDDYLRFEKELKVINPNDILIHLGDVVFDVANKLFLKFKNHKCKKILVIGNHDKGILWHMNNGFDFACDNFSINRFGYDITFNHIPLNLIRNNNAEIMINGHLHRHDITFNHNQIILPALKIFSLEQLIKEYNLINDKYKFTKNLLNNKIGENNV